MTKRAIFKTVLKMGSTVLVGVIIPHFARADYGIDRLMSSYIVAKAEVAQAPGTDDEAKAHPYTVQVASYINEKDAVSHLDELKGQVKGQKLRYFPTFVHGQVWYKVCVGEFVTKEEAESYKKDFVKRTDEPFAVVISLLDRPKGEKDTPAADADTDGGVKPVARKRKPASSKGDKVTPFGTQDGGTDNQELQSVPTFSAAKGLQKLAEVDPNTEAAARPSVKMIDVKAVAKKEMKAAASNVYSLQVGSYPSEDLAKQNIDKMGATKDSAFVQSAMVNGKKWFRVYVGKFKSKKEAEAFQKTLAGQESFVRHLK